MQHFTHRSRWLRWCGQPLSTRSQSAKTPRSLLYSGEPARDHEQIFCCKIFLCHRFVKHDDQRDEFRAFTMTSHKLHLAVRGDARDDILQGRTCETGIARMSMRSTSSINLRRLAWLACQACLRIEA